MQGAKAPFQSNIAISFYNILGDKVNKICAIFSNNGYFCATFLLVSYNAQKSNLNFG